MNIYSKKPRQCHGICKQLLIWSFFKQTTSKWLHNLDNFELIDEKALYDQPVMYFKIRAMVFPVL